MDDRERFSRMITLAMEKAEMVFNVGMNTGNFDLAARAVDTLARLIDMSIRLGPTAAPKV